LIDAVVATDDRGLLPSVSGTAHAAVNASNFPERKWKLLYQDRFSTSCFPLRCLASFTLRKKDLPDRIDFGIGCHAMKTSISCLTAVVLLVADPPMEALPPSPRATTTSLAHCGRRFRMRLPG
jgi:hypothetical protein